MARKGREHIYGPYAHRGRYRLIFVDGRGGRSPVSFETEGEAIAFRDKARTKIEGRRVSETIDEYIADRTADGLREVSLITIKQRLMTMFDAHGDRDGGLLADVTPARARALLDALTSRKLSPKRKPEGAPTEKPRSVDYRAGALAYTRTFMAWCVGKGYARADPFAGLAVKGKRRKGKRQLHGTEAERWVDRALIASREWTGWHADAALAAVLALLLGARAGEVSGRQCRDVDSGGAVLWITESKTEAGKRRCGVPEFLRAELHARAQRGKPNDPLFPGVTRYRLLKVVYRLCDEAGVPRVCTQSMRGLHGTLATEAGATAEAVARQLGHADTVVTHQHYIQPAATAAAASRRVLSVVRGGRA